ncbi:5-aminolevulinate synthase, nonspecific, mitochondrial, partial [Stegodyphus mimosarum]
MKAANTKPEDDVMDLTSTEKAEEFQYEDFFREQIDKKKRDHSYRVFKKVNRLAGNFPCAKEYTHGDKDIIVWCS